MWLRKHKKKNEQCVYAMQLVEPIIELFGGYWLLHFTLSTFSILIWIYHEYACSHAVCIFLQFTVVHWCFTFCCSFQSSRKRCIIVLGSKLMIYKQLCKIEYPDEWNEWKIYERKNRVKRASIIHYWRIYLSTLCTRVNISIFMPFTHFGLSFVAQSFIIFSHLFFSVAFTNKK